MRPIISVVIPVYNGEDYVGGTLERLLRHTPEEVEVVVVDDGSSDGTSLVLEGFSGAAGSFKYVSVPNGGVSKARNLGVELSRGRWIQFLDADDCMSNNRLNFLVENIERWDEFDLVYGPSFMLRNGRVGRVNYSKGPFESESDLADALTRDNLFPIHAPVFRRELFERVGGFNDNMRYCEDYELWIRMFIAGGRFRFHASPRLSVYYRRHSSNTSSNEGRLLLGKLETYSMNRSFMLQAAISKRRLMEGLLKSMAGYNLLNRERLKSELGRRVFWQLPFDLKVKGIFALAVSRSCPMKVRRWLFWQSPWFSELGK